MWQQKRRALGSAFFFFLASCSQPPLSRLASTVLRRYSAADCIASDAVIRNIHIETPQPGIVKLSDAFTGRHIFVHATATEMRVASGITLFIRENTTLYEYRLNPVQFQNRIEVLSENLPPLCHE